MTPAISLLMFALAVARVTRLINEDALLDGPRARAVAWAWRRRYGAAITSARREDGEIIGQFPAWRVAQMAGALEPKVAYLIGCPWCASIYVGAVAAPLWYWAGLSPWCLVPAAALAFSYVTGLLAQVGGK